MTKIFTLEQLSETSHNASSRLNKLLKNEEKEGPSTVSIDSILAYSKALGTSNTRSLGKQIMTLN